MHILANLLQVVNDDGPPSNQSSPYVHSFVSALQRADHTVSVVLPHTQRSWIGKAHIVGQAIKPTYFRPGTLHEDDGVTTPHPLPADSSEEEWILIDSTPASCVQIGLYHYFKSRGPIDLVISGPNYGRNTTAVFALSSGTLGGAMEAAICGVKAIALSYAFFDRNHDPEIIRAASEVSVQLIEKLMSDWKEESGVQLYSINVPLKPDVRESKIVWARMLQNHWTSGSCFQEIEVPDDEDQGPEEREMEIREGGEKNGGNTPKENGHIRYMHKHFKWAPRFKDVYDSVEKNGPGSDGWAVQRGMISVTPLRANFMHVDAMEGELKL
ncbi:putative tubulin--tyrosine ligase pby1 [Coniosporium apollinis]|uniref:Tubulin--tyrosine ligase pby1 n=1 Tax=Coniosporium apollinis TaxID=61459 RepID=A0ABQ9NQL3_9PEZI|nr:putative tubulin--tyrosine ligase pby1 [Coniosporium apollinis]